MDVRRAAYAWLARSDVGRRALSARRAVRSLSYLGNRYSCPLCGWSFRQMMPFGFEHRENASCPRCGSLERHRSLWLFLERRVGFSGFRGRMLHVAPEQALMRRFERTPGIEYVTFDLSSPLAQFRGDVCELPFEDASFDAVLCNHVLEHVPDDARAMRQLRRVLRPSGWAMLQVPWDPARETTYEDASIVTPEARARAFGQFDHVRIYGRDYVGRLRAAGFDVELDRVDRFFPEPERARHALLDHEELFFCRPAAVQ